MAVLLWCLAVAIAALVFAGKTIWTLRAERDAWKSLSSRNAEAWLRTCGARDILYEAMVRIRERLWRTQDCALDEMIWLRHMRAEYHRKLLETMRPTGSPENDSSIAPR